MRWWASRSRALALVLFTAASVGVFASPLVRASNSIGQDLGPWQGEEYRLILGEERRTLYQGERLLFTEERSSEGARIVVRRQDDDGQVTVTIIEDGHPIQRQTGGEKTLYQYDDEGRLLLRTILVDDHIVAVEAFSYRFEELSAVATLGSDENLRTFFHRGDERIYAYSIKGEGESYTQRSEGGEIIEAWRRGEESVRATIEEREAGGYTVHRGERVEVYDSAALLIQTIDPVMVINYRYNESKELTAEERISSTGDESITYYEEGRAVSGEQRSGGVLKKTIRYQDDGSRIETLYAEEKPYSDVTYEPGSNRVRSIVYR